MANKRKQPAWSRRKRIGVAVLGTVGIILVAYVIGGGVYMMMTKMGWIDRDENMRNQVIEEVLKDEKLVSAIQETEKTEECINTDLGFHVKYQPPVKLMTDQGEEACLQWELSGTDGTTSRIIISKTNMDPPEALNQLLAGMDKVMAKSIYYQDKQGTQVEGVRDDKQYVAYVMGNNADNTWIVELIPANELSKLALEFMVSSMKMF